MNFKESCACFLLPLKASSLAVLKAVSGLPLNTFFCATNLSVEKIIILNSTSKGIIFFIILMIL